MSNHRNFAFNSLLKSPYFGLLALFAVMTVIVGPWRNSSPQDDAAWTYSALSLLSGGGVHFGVIAVGFAQMIAGIAAIKVFSFLPAISVMNFLTWTLFLAQIFIFYRITRIHWLILAAFFSFPVWVQYGSIFHGEIYSSLLFILLIGFLSAPEKFDRFQVPIAVLLSFFLGTQLQNMAAFSFFWGFFMIFRKGDQRRIGLSLIAGSILSAFSFLLMPKSPWQASYGYWMTQSWLEMGARAPVDYALYLVQLFAAAGLFILPAAKIRERKVSEWIFGLVVYLILTQVFYRTDIAIMSGGVMFLEYFPKFVGVAVLNFGIWGWWGILPYAKKLWQQQDSIPVAGTLIAWIVILLFCTYRHTLDLRYAMSWGLPILFHLRGALSEKKFSLGNQPVYLAGVLAVSMVCNVYYLNTTDARWRTADALKEQGHQINEIAAGYGWNFFYTTNDCMKKAVAKIEQQTDVSPYWKSELFFNRFIRLYGRTYEDEWVPKVVIKPSKLLGKSLDLQKYRLPGQDSEPVRFVDYSVLGIPCQLAVFENKSPKPAWCDQ